MAVRTLHGQKDTVYFITIPVIIGYPCLKKLICMISFTVGLKELIARVLKYMVTLLCLTIFTFFYIFQKLDVI